MNGRKPEEIYEDIDANDRGFQHPKTSDPDFWEAHIAYQDARARLWRELYEATLRDPDTPRWAFQAAGMVAGIEKQDAAELHRRAERAREVREDR